jgi:beta-glucanase (GH16 family)
MFLRSTSRCALVIALLNLSALSAVAQSGKLLWSDEFSGAKGGKPDPSKWTYDIGGNGWGNKELETYTDSTQNAFLDGDGHLIIRALKQPDGRITSARLKTQGLFSFTYGRAEARMKLPRTQGMWPAFWMLGSDIKHVSWPACGEIDIMESLGREPTVVHGTVHGPGYSGKGGISAQYVLPGAPALADDFHVYAADWTSDSIKFSIDDHAYATVTHDSLSPGAKWVYDHPFFLLLNLAVGGSWPRNPDASTVFPQDLIVDYVRVYAAPKQ